MTTETHTGTQNTTNNSTGAVGIKIHVNVACSLTQIVQQSLSHATNWFVGTSGYGSSNTGSGTISGTTATMNVALSAGTDYYITISGGGSSVDLRYGAFTFPQNGTLVNVTGGYAGDTNWWGPISFDVATAETATNIKVNVGDAWKTVTGAKVNVGDAWKTVTGAQVNVGDAWKKVF